MIVFNIISCSFFYAIAKQSRRVLAAPASGQSESKTRRLDMDPIQKPQFSCNSWREKKKLTARPSTSSSEDDVSYACVYVDTGLFPIFDE
ncbi:uncharacterized protein LOC112569435 isoform X3 [Pomacea canaliculata]|uniref:uncharacterized protein LOC112569435 isoform X3 n=1 Tax=Pomacea canaliculata TaxID=400727 RepID=UPI000D72BA8F|nr:uncharacterized protein LOC112569435 isoform X3 [Pomacea canaliculata]